MQNKKYHLLLVDDDNYNLNMLKRIFREYDLSLAADGYQALDILQKQEVDLILTDQRMPGMMGTELLEKAIEMQPNAIRMILSAYSDIPSLTDAINKGNVYRYVTKPFDNLQLKKAIEQALSHYESSMAREYLTIQLKKKNTELEESNKKLQETIETLGEAQKQMVLLEQDHLISNLASMLIHDIKQPISVFHNCAGILHMDNVTDNERKKLARVMDKEVEKLRDFVDELMALGVGKQDMTLKTIAADKLVKELERLFTEAYSKTTIKLTIDGDMDFKLACDLPRMGRAIMNVLNNSVEALGEHTDGQIHIHFEVFTKLLQMSISDNGPGFPRDEHLFEPFYTKNKKNGNGLGLAIVQKYIRNHRGQVYIDRKYTNGARIVIKLPIV
jgi:two-component system sensor histidine kinase/response regulator